MLPLLLLAVALAGTTEEKPPPSSARVVSVYDGDTFTLDSGDKVRVKNINTTELRSGEEDAEAARDAATAFVLGKTVTLEYGDKVRDSYGRLVAEAFVDGQSLSVHLVQKGLAHVMMLPPIPENRKEILDAQVKARAAGIGIWSDEHFQGTVHITSFHANARGNDREQVNNEYLRVCNVADGDLNVKGYQIMNSRGKVYVWPDLTIPAGQTVEVHSGRGDTQGDPSKQLMIYLQSDIPIWNNAGDTATIYDAEGKKMDWKSYTVGR